MNMIIYIAVVIVILYILGNVVGYILVGVFCHIFSYKSSKQKKNEHDSAVNANKKESRFHDNFVGGFVCGIIHYFILDTGRIPSFSIRHFFYRHIFCMKITRKTIIYGGCEFRSPWNIKIGNSVIGPRTILDGRSGIIIGDNVCISNQVNIWTNQHDTQDSMFGVNKGIVIIDDYAWISSRVTILPGRTVNKGAIIASGAVVTKDCEEFKIYGGVPAVIIGERNKNLTYQFDKHWYFI